VQPPSQQANSLHPPPMPIRFRCPSCNQMLGIASRKAGSQIDCPTCGMAQRVPTEEEAAMLAAAAAKSPLEAAPPAAAAIDATLAATIEIPPTIDVGPRSPGGTDRDAFDLASAVGKPVPSDMILFRRQTFYVHGLLFLLLALAGFGLGYLVGRGDARYELETDEDAAAKKQIPLAGKVVYAVEQGRSAGDEDAVVIALPEEKKLSKPFSIQGIRPHDVPSTESETTLRLIRAFGGNYARADALGEFTLNLPERGKYRLLIISAHVKRPPRSDVEEPHLVAMGTYFTAPELLIGRSKYCWLSRDVNSGSRSVDWDFGYDEK
jgi:phage FluMu protein Com